MKAFRISKAKYASSAFEGTGSKRAGGRWNSPGCAIVYTSENRATAALEILVHLRSAQLLRDDYVLFEVDVPDALVATLALEALPEGWNAPIEIDASTDIGDAWFDTRASVALRVPSAVIRGENNLLLNPEHPDFAQVTIHPPEAFLFDARLAGDVSRDGQTDMQRWAAELKELHSRIATGSQHLPSETILNEDREERG